jgi:hypothetical protein
VKEEPGPGALVPALLDNGESGRFFHAQDYAGLSLATALEKARRKSRFEETFPDSSRPIH